MTLLESAVAQREIHFYAPGLKRFRTGEYGAQDHKAFVSISITGTACALKCDHCEMKVLQGMASLAGGKSLFELCSQLAEGGARGVLLSGGCDSRGRVPIMAHIEDIRRIRSELGLTIRVHPGLVDEDLAEALGDIDIDGAMVDIIGSNDTIRDVYHMDLDTAEYQRTLERLNRYDVPTVPHIVLGLHYGRFLGEERALEMIAQYPPKLLVLVILMPLYGTAMAQTTPPSTEAIGDFFQLARTRMPETPIALGCARPAGISKQTIDEMAIDAGFNGIAYPADGAVAYAEAHGMTPRFHDACCGVNW
jgi:uncharacterized radical SAM superfamily protein